MQDNAAIELNDAIEAFIHDGQIEPGTPVYDIARQALTAAFESLTPDQVRIFEAKLRGILSQVAAA